MVDWWDIFLHSIVAVLFSASLGYGASVMRRQGKWYHKIGIASFAFAALFGIAIFWLAREQGQHGGAVGGLQSKLEWIVPALLSPLSFLLAFRR